MITCTTHYSKRKFPVGELHVWLTSFPSPGTEIDITWTFESNEEIIELLLLCDALKRALLELRCLRIPYFPFGRQDRVAVEGESLSVAVMAGLINGLKAESVEIIDPHSDVTTALIDRCSVLTQAELFKSSVYHQVFRHRPFYLVSPDAGALKKIYQLAAYVTPLGIIECSKHRNVATGEITGVHVQVGNLEREHCIIVDDICDGGRSFIEIAKRLKYDYGFPEVTLLVSHGFFTQGLKVFDNLIDHIYTREGQVK